MQTPFITLEVVEGPQKGKTFSFVGHDTFLVGRSPEAHLRLSSKDRYFSRIHFMIEVNPPVCRLVDMGSRNGTFVNGQRANVVDLKDGDQIRAGHTVLRVRFDASERREPETMAYSAAVQTLVKPGTAATATADNVCRACLTPLPALVEPRFSASAWPLCDECLGQLKKQAQTIPNYQLVRRLGKGAMGVVYLAVRITDGLAVALKTIVPAISGSQTDYDRFLREAEILRRLHHPNIVGFHEIAQAEGQIYFAMEYVPGHDAQQLVQSQGPLEPAYALAIILDVLDGLSYAHALGFVHRDIKPANILLPARDNGGPVAKIGDFGLARVYQASHLSGLTLHGDVGGTAGYLAPEQITSFRDAKPAADQYSAAATLYTLLTGKLVFDMPDRFHEQILMILHDDPVPLRARRPELPEKLEAVVHRALAKRPEERFADVREFRDALAGGTP